MSSTEIDDKRVQILQGVNGTELPVNFYFDEAGLLVRIVRWNSTASGVVPTQIDYSMTVEDPEVLTAPWTARYPMYLEPDYGFFEYACHEDNTAVRNFIVTSRYERAKLAQQAAN